MRRIISATFAPRPRLGVKHGLLTMRGSTPAVTHETAAAAVVQLWLALAFRGAGREECNVFEQLSHAVIFSQHKEPN